MAADAAENAAARLRARNLPETVPDPIRVQVVVRGTHPLQTQVVDGPPGYQLLQPGETYVWDLGHGGGLALGMAAVSRVNARYFAEQGP